MYRVLISGVERDIEAEGVSIDQGTILFFADKEESKVNCVIPNGKWEKFQVMGGSDALQIRETKKILKDKQAGSGKEVRRAQPEVVADAAEEKKEDQDSGSKEAV